MKNYFVTAIHTDSGKTLVSSILCESLGYNYWKPVQSGLPTDTTTVKSLVSRTDISFFPEQYKLKLPASPHAAAESEGVEISLDDFNLPESSKPVIVEGAGGIMVPINPTHFMIDLVEKLNLEIILVSNLYLGSINHTLLSWEYLKSKNLPVKGIVFNGPSNAASEAIILHHTNLKVLLRIDAEAMPDKAMVKRYASKLNPHDF